MFVTPDALAERWDGGKLHGALCVDLNGAPLGRADAGVDMTFDFGQLIAHAAKTRRLGAGTIIGSGTVSNRDADGGPGRPIAEGGLGYSCLAEVRTVETILTGAAKTAFMQAGDTVRIWMDDDRHHSIFGAIRAGGGITTADPGCPGSAFVLPWLLTTCRRVRPTMRRMPDPGSR